MDYVIVVLLVGLALFFWIRRLRRTIRSVAQDSPPGCAGCTGCALPPDERPSSCGGAALRPPAQSELPPPAPARRPG